jgi:hypothetical protein
LLFAFFERPLPAFLLTYTASNFLSISAYIPKKFHPQTNKAIPHPNADSTVEYLLPNSTLLYLDIILVLSLTAAGETLDIASLILTGLAG